MMASRIILVLLVVHAAVASNPCCPSGDNRIARKKCADGSPVQLPCPFKYLTKKEDGMTVDVDDDLIIASARIPPDRYCATKSNQTDLFVVCFSEDALEGNSAFTVYAVLELISVVFILLTIFVYSQVREVLDLQGVCIVHSISGLAVSFLVLAVNQLMPYRIEKTKCMTVAYIIYFTMLYSFFWLNVLAFHIWRTIVKPSFFRIHKYWPYIYHGFGCGGPVILLIILLIAHSMPFSDIHPGFGETKCWFKTTKTQFVYFYGPMAVLLCLNVIYYGWTIGVLWRRFSQTDEKKVKVLKYRLLLCVKLFFIMGISWIFELLSAAFQEVDPVLQTIWYVTDGLNTLQGILIFLILVVLRKRVIRGLADRSLCGVRLPSRWRAAADDECEEFEEELNLSETQIQKL
ncbi:probable G-protein coupled receptor Mth-like 1 isoform X3 [Zophobas morio]